MKKEPTKKQLIKALTEMKRAADLLFNRNAIVQPFLGVYKRNLETMAWIVKQDEPKS